MTGKQIVALRKKLGLTQEEFAERLGSHRVTITRWESGKAKPDRLYLQELNKLRPAKDNKSPDLTKFVIPTGEEIQEFVSRLTPSELRVLRARVANIFATVRRSRF